MCTKSIQQEDNEREVEFLNQQQEQRLLDVIIINYFPEDTIIMDSDLLELDLKYHY